LVKTRTLREKTTTIEGERIIEIERGASKVIKK